MTTTTRSEIEERLGVIARELVGRPYEWLARGPGSFYCLGLLLYLLEEAAGVRLEDPYAGGGDHGALLAFWRRFRALELGQEPVQALDAVFTRGTASRVPHVSVVVSPGWAIQVERTQGLDLSGAPIPGQVHRVRITDAIAPEGAEVYRLHELDA